MGRAPCCDKDNVKKGPWSPEEDATLKAYIEQYGTGNNWIALPQKIGLKRCGKSCRLRWLNYLRPNIKHGGFSDEEDNIICSLYISIGSRWSIIAAQLPGRTDNDIKNYWNTRLKKKLLGRNKSHINPRSQDSMKDGNEDQVEDNSFSHLMTNSAVERLQLHMQLQSLRNPLSFFQTPARLPKLHPLHEKMMIQSLQYMNNEGLQYVAPRPCHPGLGNELPNVNSNNLVEHYCSKMQNSLNDVTPSGSSAVFANGTTQPNSISLPESNGTEQFHAGIQPVLNFQGELDDFFNNKSVDFVPQEDQVAEFDYFKEMELTKDGMMWCSNDFDSNSASSNSWDSTSAPQMEGMFQHYAY